MKYIVLASILSSAAFAAPMAQVQGQTNANTGAVPNRAGTAGAGQAATGQTPQQGTQGQVPGQAAPAGSTGAQNSPQQGASAANGQTPTTADLATAVANWMADTSMVSNFLNTGASIQNNVAFKQAATVAFNAEVDELNHKAIIDRATGTDPNVIAANSTLATGGAFQDVVDKLQIMSVQGRAAVANIDLINQNRCTNVLPNIDAYMASTGQPGQAVRPAVCDMTGVIGGVQSNGPTLPGQTPGTPQAAFDAAKALAAGTGNGLVNGGAGGQQAQGQQAQGQQAQGQQAQGQQAQGQQAQGQQAQGQQAQGQQAQGQQAQGQQAQGQQAQGQQAQGQQAQGQQAQGQAGAQTGAQTGARTGAQGQQAQTGAQGQQAQAGAQTGAQAQQAQTGATAATQ